MLQKFLRLPAVLEATGLSCSTIYERIGQETFPKPFPLGPKAVGWLESEIIEWQKKRLAEPRGSQSELPDSWKLKAAAKRDPKILPTAGKNKTRKAA